MQQKSFPTARLDNIVVYELKDEILIYDLKINKAFCLNETSALVWKLCDGKRSVSEIAGEISRITKLPVSDELIWFALNQLRKDNLLSNAENIIPPLNEHINELTRREVIRKIGFAAAISLPLVSSLIAPTAAQSASNNVCSKVDKSCSQNSDCCPNQGLTCDQGCGVCVSGLGGCI